MRSTTETSNGAGAKPSVPSLSGAKRSRCKTEKRYLGVRVRMPVRDLLRNIRIAKGMDPKDIQKISGKASKGDKKRVKTSVDRRNSQKKCDTMAQEELSIIVEVLEEDLKMSTSKKQTNKFLASPSNPERRVLPKAIFPQTFVCELSHKTEIAPSLEPYSPPVPSPESICSFPRAEYRKSFAILADNVSGYSSDDSEDFCTSPQLYAADSPSRGDYQFPSYHDSCQSSPEPSSDYSGLDYSESVVSPGFHSSCHQGTYQQEEWANDFYFWNQLEREGNHLKGISNRELLVPDKNGKLLIHRLVEEGKRAPVYIVAKRMAAMMQLDAKDREGKTALHLSAQRNHHVMVADLISLGANVSEKDLCGKTCLHLSAESGYVRVLEVIKNAMKDGVHVDLEVKDVNGLSVLQTAAMALRSAVREGELCSPQAHGRLHALRKEQMMETLECLLYMESNMHTVEICLT